MSPLNTELGAVGDGGLCSDYLIFTMDYVNFWQFVFRVVDYKWRKVAGLFPSRGKLFASHL